MRFKPMLAHPARDELALLRDLNFVAERKYDGHRAMFDLVNGEMHLWSRIGHDNLRVAPFVKKLGRAADEMVIDGELVVPGGSSSDVADQARRAELIYVVFDILSCKGESLVNQPYSHRRALLADVVSSVKEESIQLSEVSSEGNTLFQRVKEEGGEGVMLKDRNGLYSPGKRSWAWQKVKIFTTYDVVVTGCDAEPTRWTVRPGQVGTDGVFYPDGKPSSTSVAGFVGLTYGWHIDGQLSRVGKLGYTGNKEQLEPLVGKVAEVKGYGLYKTGAIRHPLVIQFREDKKPEECVFSPAMATI